MKKLANFTKKSVKKPLKNAGAALAAIAKMTPTVSGAKFGMNLPKRLASATNLTKPQFKAT
jgi:hypothetical protein